MVDYLENIPQAYIDRDMFVSLRSLRAAHVDLPMACLKPRPFLEACWAVEGPA